MTEPLLGDARDRAILAVFLLPPVVDLLLLVLAAYAVGHRSRLLLMAWGWFAVNVVLLSLVAFRYVPDQPVAIALFLTLYRIAELELFGLRKLLLALWNDGPAEPPAARQVLATGELDFPRPGLLVLYAYLVLGAWVGLAIAVVGIVVSFSFGVRLWGLLGVLLVIPFLVAALAIAPGLRCPNCRRRVTLQGWAPPHPNGSRLYGFEGWAAVILSVLLHRRFACIHCGAHVQV